MIVREYFKTRKDGVRLFKTFSDEGRCIRQLETGFVYDMAIDVEAALYTYEETDKMIIENEGRQI